MAIFGFGGSSARSQGSSQSTSLDYGANVSSSFSDSLASSLSQSQAAGSSFGTQNVWNADVLQNLYSGALGAAGATDANLFSGQAQQLYGAGAGFLDTLGVGAGEDYLQSRLTDTSARDAQLGELRTGLGELFRDELNPAITGRAVATGKLGGGQQGVAQAGAASAIGRSYATGAADIMGRDQLARDQAAGTLGSLRTGRAATGFQGIGATLGAAQAGLGAQLSPYSALAGIIGGPTVLTQQGSQDVSTSTASSQQIAQAISQAMGFNYGTSQATSQQSSKSKSFNFGLG